MMVLFLIVSIQLDNENFVLKGFIEYKWIEKKSRDLTVGSRNEFPGRNGSPLILEWIYSPYYPFSSSPILHLRPLLFSGDFYYIF